MLCACSKSGLLTTILVAATWAPGRADVWDPGDDTNATANQLLPGTEQIHDLVAPGGGAVDEDWYFVHLPHRTSWEFRMEGLGSGVGGASDPFQLVDPAGILILHSVADMGPSRTLRYEHAAPDTVYFMRAASTGCTSTCGPESVYVVRARETTLAVPRFNNSATQTTVLILQNRAPNDPSTGHVWFLAADGTELANQPFFIAAAGTLVLNTATVPGVAGQGGSMLVTHLGRFGELEGKAVALEPATGFTFDTPVLVRAQ
jgi:hypothetical protein